MKKNKKIKKKEQKIRPLTEAELLEEEKRYQACKKPIRIGWAIYTFSATLYLVGGLAANSAAKQIPQKTPIVESLNEYRYSEEYSDFITDAQKHTIDSLQKGEITVDEYEHIMSTLSSDEKFEEFLRSLENDKRVQRIISEYDENAKQLEILFNVMVLSHFL